MKLAETIERAQRAGARRLLLRRSADAAPFLAWTDEARAAVLAGGAPPALPEPLRAEIEADSAEDDPRTAAWRLVGIRGLSPTRVRALYKELGIDSPEALLHAAELGRLEGAAGIGATDVPELVAAAREMIAEAGMVRSIATELARRQAGAEVPGVRRVSFDRILRDPRTGETGFRLGPDRATGRRSGREVPIVDGVIDLLDAAPTPSPAQALMETGWYSALYEEVFRPSLTRVVTRQSLPDAIALHVRLLRLSRGAAVLDLACGTGNFARAIARELDPEAGFVVGLDLSAPMLRRASALRAEGRIRHLHLVRGDAHDLPFADGTLDAVHCAGALHLMPRPERVLQECARVLRPGGLLVIGTFVEARSAAVRRLQQRLRPRTGFEFFAPDALAASIADAGFAVRETILEGLAISLAAERQAPQRAPR